MSANPEPLAAILADYRADIPAMTSGGLPHPTPEYLRIMLDRIEAAVKLELSKNRPNNGSKIGQFGNAAAMREVLEQALAYCESDQKSGIAYSDNDVLVPMLRAALAAPARKPSRNGKVEPPRGKGNYQMTNLELVAAELAAAKKKNPKFVDFFFREVPQFDVVGFELNDARKRLQYKANAGFVDFGIVLRCEVWEAIEAYVKGDLARARQELAQCAAVCIRAMEYIEKEMENKTK